jgi:hypothetical protein
MISYSESAEDVEGREVLVIKGMGTLGTKIHLFIGLC